MVSLHNSLSYLQRAGRQPLPRRCVFPLAIALIVPWLAGGCRQQVSQDEIAALAKKQLSEQAKQVKEEGWEQIGRATGKEFRISGSDGQKPLWKLTAKEARYKAEPGSMTPQRALLTDARAILYRNGKEESAFHAANIEFTRTDAGGIKLLMTKGVEAHTSGVYVNKGGPIALQAPRLEVDVKQHHLWASEGGTMVQGTGDRKVTVTAKDVHADTGMQQVNLKGQVQAVAARGKVTADEATWNWATEQAQAKGNVTATSEGTTITGAELNADARTERGLLSGGARAVSAQGTAQAHSVHYDWGSGKLYAEGGVTLSKDGATLRAERIDTNKDLNAATATGGVTLVKQDVTIRAARVSAYDGMTRAQAGGDVTMTRGDITVKAGSVVATSLQDQARTRIVAGDGVRLNQGDLAIRAAQAEVSDLANGHAGRLVVTGGVTLSQPGIAASAGRVEAVNLSTKNQARLFATGSVRFEQAGVVVTAARIEASDLSNRVPASLTASGDVIARNRDGTVRANRVARTNGQITATGNVTLVRQGSTLTGERLESDDKFTNATLTGNVHGQLAQGGMAMPLTAGMLIWQKPAGRDNSQGRVLGRRGVTLQRADMRLRADRLDATADGVNATLAGNVVVTGSEGTVMRAPQARYDGRVQKVYVTGGVAFQSPRYGNLRGPTAVYNVRTRQAVLDSPRGGVKVPMDLFRG